MKRYFYQALFFACIALFATVLFARTVFATTTCNISTNTTIDATYVNANTCDVIALTGTPTITWSGTIDADQPVLVQVNSGTVVFSGALVLGRAESSVTVASGATVTHAAEDKTGVQITAQTVTVTGSINTDSKGCAVNKGVNGTGDCATGNAGTPGNNYSGGAHGGAGGSGYFTSVNTGTYGSSTNPTLLGSGGGAAGRAGGGRVSLIVSGVLTIAGSVTANGAAGGDLTPGGSGGSIYVKAATLDGTGTITSNGGAGGGGCSRGGEGGGGRIAIYYDAGTFGFTNASKITVAHGTGGCSDSKNGTTFIVDRQVDDGAGNLVFNGGGLFHAGGDFTRNSITVTSGSYLQCATGLTSLTVSSTQAISWSNVSWDCSPTAASSFKLASDSSLTLATLTASFGGSMGDATLSGTSLSTSAVTWSFSGANTLTFAVPTYTNTTASSFTMTKAGAYTTFGTTGALTLNNFTFTGGSPGTSNAHGGHLLFPSNIDLTFTNAKIYANVSSTLASLSLDSSSLISANGKGCQLAYGPSASNVCTSATAGAGASYGGAGHGGVGGTGYFSGGGAVYGSSTYPILFGSGSGGNGSGVGGGRVHIVTTGSLTLGGPISVNGSGTGGSGGSIYLLSNAFSGSGALAATGSNGDGSVGCGAGGRIAMISSLFTFSGTSSTIAGATSCTGAAGVGTIYKLEYVIPTTPSFTAPTSGIYNASRTPSLIASTYSNSPYAAHLNTDWKVTTDSGGSSTVWSSLTDASNLTTTIVDGSHGAFAGVLAGQDALAASSTYYAFVRYRNSVGPSSWSTATTFTTAFAGASSTMTLNFSDTTSTEVFTYDPDYVEVNASSNGYARMKDLGSSTYGFSLAYPSTYTRVKKLTVTNQVASVLTDFQTKVTVTYDPDMQSDFDDIRFTSSDGITNIPFWLESKTNDSSAIFYVKVPSLPASGTSTIYMYYGDASVASGSSGTSTFLFFDDFNDGDINGWTSFAAESPAVAPLVTAASNALRINGSASSNMEGGAVYGGYTFTNGIYEADVTLDTYALAGQETHMFARMSSIGTNPTGYRFGPLWAGANDLNLARETGHANLTNTSYTYGAGTSRKMSFTLSGSSLKGSVNGTQYLSTTDANYSSGYLGFVIDARHESQAAMQSTIDNVRVRQYVATEPSVSAGSEVVNIGFTAASVVTIDNGSLAEYAHLYRMVETLMPGSTGSVAYQLSADGVTWKYWNGSAWATASAEFSQTNSSSTLNSYLPIFGAQIGSGKLYVRIVFSSNGTQPVGLDALTFYYLLSNVAPSAPDPLGPASLVDGSTTSTNTPTFSFTLSDTDMVDTVRYQIQIDDVTDFSSPTVDYTSALAAQGDQVFEVGQDPGSGSYAVGAQDQTLSDGQYYWRVRAIDSGGSPSSYSSATTGTVAFIVDTVTRTLQFASTTATGVESVASVSLPVELDQSHFVTSTANYSVTAGTATAAIDYTLATGTVSFAPGQTTTTISLTILDDEIDEPIETLTVTLTDPLNATLGVATDFVYTITDNDTAGLTIAGLGGSTAVTEGGVTDSFTVVLTSEPTSTVQIAFATTTNGVTLSSDLLSFTDGNWNIPQTVTITAFDDAIFQGTHTGTITPTIALGGYGFFDLVLDPLIATVTDNDTAGVTITESSGSTAVTEGGATDSFTAVLTSQPTSTVQVLFTTSTYGVMLSVAEVSFDESNWSTPQTVTVTAVNDAVAEGSQVSSVAFSVNQPSGTSYGYADLVLSSLSVQVTDNDEAGIILSKTALEVSEAGDTDAYTVVLGSQPTSTVTLSFSPNDQITLSTSTILFTALNWSTPVTVSSTAVNDLVAEGSHNALLEQLVSSSAYGYDQLTLDEIEITIEDNDTAGVTFSATAVQAGEGDYPGIYTLVLAAQPTSTVLVLLSPESGITLSTSTVAFTASNWNVPVEVVVHVTDDEIAQGTRTVRVMHALSSSLHGYDALILSAVSVEIEDDEQGASSTSGSGGGGGGGGGGAAGSALPISTLSPTPAPAQSPSKVPPPVIIVLPQPGEAPTAPPVLLPNQAVIAILNPSDVVSLVQATNGGRNIEAEGKNLTLVQKDAKEFAVPLKNTNALTLTNFITYGISDRTRALGEGERRALVRDALETMKTSVIATTDLERLARGMVPEYRNLTVERKQLPRVRSTFKALYGRDPNFKSTEENLAWNTLMYRIRFERNLTAERKGIVAFQKTFKKKPEQPFQWATVRVMGYIQK